MRLTVLVVALAVAVPTAAFAGPASDEVKFFYVPAVKFEADEQYRDRFTEPVTKLFDLNDQAIKKNPGEVACIDFDPGLDAQDFDQKTVSKTLKLVEKLDGDNAEVTASFSLLSEGDDSKRDMVWSLKKIDGKWKISDIASKTSDWKLSTLECMAGQD
ncbi:YbjP/YqhG family protein [Mesorhizobium sp. AR07]|uniref:YbjP/YqhG family protein n=1 Tax=Mesorhizobium sp. AR07 TaxID=2865838 RepID=UPI00215EA5B3|nr:YbjP/YqhG family protein [Mesorhizobium sp. AR07]UVK44794.1 YbjP/YqhG family protein [Mesorhizobium sp. AR07]